MLIRYSFFNKFETSRWNQQEKKVVRLLYLWRKHDLIARVPNEIIATILRMALQKSVIIKFGCNYAFCIFEGKAYVWGINDCGQLGLGDTCERDTPTEVIIPGETITNVSCKTSTTFIQTLSGKTYVCGQNRYGQLGLGDTKNRHQPTELILPGNIIKNISCGPFHAIALTEKGEAYVWGLNEDGQLGLGDKVERHNPTRVIIPDKITNVSCSDYDTLLQTDKGEIFICGGGRGLWHLNDIQESYKPEKLTIKNEVISQMSDGEKIVIFTRSGKAYVWGDNRYGQLGLGDNRDRHHLTELSLDGEIIINVSCSSFHTLILTKSGKLFSCGINFTGELGLGDPYPRNKPTEVETYGRNIVQIGAEDSHSYYVTKEGEVYASGIGSHGEFRLKNHNDQNEFTLLDLSFENNTNDHIVGSKNSYMKL